LVEARHEVRDEQRDTRLKALLVIELAASVAVRKVMVAPAASYSRIVTFVRRSVARVREQDVSRGLCGEKHGGFGTGASAWTVTEEAASAAAAARRDAEAAAGVDASRSAAAAAQRRHFFEPICGEGGEKE
jgi:hypothetical protein